MKTIIPIFFILFFLLNICFSQVAINTDGTDPDPSAMLEVKSTEKGLLLPRMTRLERDAISTPAMGLLIFQIDEDAGFYYNAGPPSHPAWIRLSPDITPWKCGESILDYRDGKSYKTTLIGEQCWMAENLNIGTMLITNTYSTDNDIIEKFCYNNVESNCDVYGGMYQWNEMMEYTTTEGTQGICPDGWHLPTDLEWKILEGAVDTQYPIDDPIWNTMGTRGYNAGLKLKASTGWDEGGNGTDDYGFSWLPAGFIDQNGAFSGLLQVNNIWSSTAYSSTRGWKRTAYHDEDGTHRYYNNKPCRLSVRCLKD